MSEVVNPACWVMHVANKDIQSAYACPASLKQLLALQPMLYFLFLKYPVDGQAEAAQVLCHLNNSSLTHLSGAVIPDW